MSDHAGKIEVSASAAICHAAADCMAFVMQPETWPVFEAWLRKHQPALDPDYTSANMLEDLITIYNALVVNYL